MRRIRIGNDIILRIRLTRRGGAENLEGKKIGLMLRNILGSVSLPVVQSGEELIAGWQGTQQQWTGAYTVTLTEDWGENNRNTVDEACAFELVSISSDEGVETGTVNIELDMDISVPGNGLSAYEIAVLYGFEGTEEEWLESLTPDANYYNKQEIEENYYNKGEIDEYIKEHQYVIPHPKYVVGKNSDSEFLIDVSEYDGFDDNDGTKSLYFYEEEGITINSDGTYEYRFNGPYQRYWNSDGFYKRDRNKRYYTNSKYIPLGFINENNINNDKILSFYKLLSTKEAIEIGQQNGEYVQSYFYYRDNSNGYFKDKWWSIYAGTPIKNAILDISKLRTSEYIPDIKNMPGDIDRVNIFAMCRNLETVILYSSDPNVTEIEECFTKSMFQGCKNLKKVVFRGVKPKNSAFLFDRIDNNNNYAQPQDKNETSLEIISDTPISFGKGIFQFCPFGEIIGLNGFSIDDSITDLSYCFGTAHLSKDLLLPSCFLKPNNVENYRYFIKNITYGLEKINVISDDGTIKNQEYGIYIPIIPSENVNSIQVDNLVYTRGDQHYPMKVEFIGDYVGDKVIKITSAQSILPSGNKEIYADEHFEFTDCRYMLLGEEVCAYFKTSLTANMSVVFLSLRKFKCSPGFFNTKNTIDFSRGRATNVEGYFGFNDDNITSNGSLEYIAETAPEITDRNKRTLKFASYLKEAEWAAPYIAQLQEKGYTIA